MCDADDVTEAGAGAAGAAGAGAGAGAGRGSRCRSRGMGKPVLVSLGLTPKLEVGTMRGVVRVAGDFACEALGLAAPVAAPAGVAGVAAPAAAMAGLDV